MKHLRKRLTYANVMSSIAVFLVVGGGAAFAASHLGKNSVGTKQLKKNAVTTAKIKKQAVTAAKIKNATITGTQINLAKLGTVPSATNATNAANANNATNAANLSGMTRFRTSIAPGGISEATANSVTLYTDGPLSLVGKCWLEGTEIIGDAYLRTSVPAYWTSYSNTGSGGPLSPGVDKPALEEEAEATPPEAELADPYDGTFAALTADRSAYFTGLASVGANIGESGGCTFAGWAMSS